jgi:hypothetical protein
MTYQRIEESHWRNFCDVISKTLRDRPVDFEVAGLDIGDQVAAQWLTLNGLSYDPTDDAVHVFVDTGGGLHLDHLIPAPKELYAEIGAAGLSEVVVIDAEDRRHFMRLREVVRLPAPRADLAS